MAKLNLNTAQQARVNLTQKQQKHIAQIYKNAALSVGRKHNIDYLKIGIMCQFPDNQ